MKARSYDVHERKLSENEPILSCRLNRSNVNWFKSNRNESETLPEAWWLIIPDVLVKEFKMSLRHYQELFKYLPLVIFPFRDKKASG